MRVAIIAPEQLPVPPIKGGSVETCIHNISRLLPEQCQVTILCRSHPKLSPKESIYNINYVRFKALGKKKYLNQVCRFLRHKDNTFDIIQIENRPLFISRVKQSSPNSVIILNLHSVTFMQSSHISRKKGNIAVKQANAVITNSQFIQDKICLKYPKAKKKTTTIHLGVDDQVFQPYWNLKTKRRNIRCKMGLEGKKVIIFAGRIVPQKGLDILLKTLPIIMKKHPNIHLLIVGGKGHRTKKTSRYYLKLKKMVKDSSLPVTFTNFISHRKMADIYLTGNLLICPSQGPEALGLVNLEAMATGLPVVASNTGGINEAVHDGICGKLVKDFRNPKSLAKTIITLLSDKKTLSSLGAKGRSLVETHFNWNRTAREYFNLYQTLMT